ncbi:PREDICTED: coactosin-like protein [Nanorana parkeri]|uniref:coactosin-like protein n=1 Tax=Nanorana parkeri TaxID=125878 RepID=UPI0008544F44|nr:PREDICTED: coactosin-like protein [Nanorana parkeri]
MATKIDKEPCREAYNLVRDDTNGISCSMIWATEFPSSFVPGRVRLSPERIYETHIAGRGPGEKKDGYFYVFVSRARSELRTCGRGLPECGRDDVRLFAYIRVTTGDALSKRVKFALITWIGENVGGLQRAKTGTDKTLVKDIVQNFAKELVITDRKDLAEDYIKSELKKAGGANYDAQTE